MKTHAWLQDELARVVPRWMRLSQEQFIIESVQLLVSNSVGNLLIAWKGTTRLSQVSIGLDQPAKNQQTSEDCPSSRASWTCRSCKIREPPRRSVVLRSSARHIERITQYSMFQNMQCAAKLKLQNVLVLFEEGARAGQAWTYATLGEALHMSASHCTAVSNVASPQGWRSRDRAASGGLYVVRCLSLQCRVCATRSRP